MQFFFPVHSEFERSSSHWKSSFTKSTRLSDLPRLVSNSSALWELWARYCEEIKRARGEGGAVTNIKRQSSLEIITTGGDVNVKATKKSGSDLRKGGKEKKKKRIYTSA